MKAKKHFGQHFLKSQTTAQKIVGGLGDVSTQDILEVGPGMGILTQYLLENAKSFKAVEIDGDATDYLKNKWKNIEIIQADFLKINLRDYYKSSFRLIGNSPTIFPLKSFLKLSKTQILLINGLGCSN